MSKSTDPILDRLARIEQQLARLTEALDQTAPTVGMAVDAADEIAADLQRRGIDVDQRLQSALQVVERLTEPNTLQALNAVIDALPKLEALVNVAATFEDTTGMVFDMADAQATRLVEQGIDIEHRVSQVADLALRLTDPVFAEHLRNLIDAAPGLLAATRTGELFGRSVDEASQNEGERMGFWGVVGALREPEVQRAAGFAIDVARRVGRKLPEHFDRGATALTAASVPSAK